MRRLLAPIAGGVAALALAAAPVLADPWGAPGAQSGTADCGDAGTYQFLVPSGNGEGNGTAWNPAFLWNDGGRALFHPTMLDLTIDSPYGTFSFTETKGGFQGDVTCTIEGASLNSPFTLSGTVQGWISPR